MRDIKAEEFFKKIELFLIITGIICGFIVLYFWKNWLFLLSFLSGVILGFINFRTTKKEGFQLIKKVQEKLLLGEGEKSFYQKESNLYIGKTYTKLFATGIVLYLLIDKLHFSPLFIIGGFCLIYLELTLLAFITFWKNREILV